MEVVAVDILGPLPDSSAGNSYTLVACDYFTKWLEAMLSQTKRPLLLPGN